LENGSFTGIDEKDARQPEIFPTDARRGFVDQLHQDGLS
jgi:hypothetical protein